MQSQDPQDEDEERMDDDSEEGNYALIFYYLENLAETLYISNIYLYKYFRGRFRK